MTRLAAQRRLPPLRLLGGLAAAFLLIQLIPYGRAHRNPPVQTQPAWAEPDTKALFDRACADCHSNATVWPWYSNVAPASWLVQRHVDEGRQKFNVNVPGFGPEAGEAAEQVRRRKMPEPTYLPLHPEAKLTDTEREQLIQGLAATFGGAGEGPEEQDGDD